MELVEGEGGSGDYLMILRFKDLLGKMVKRIFFIFAGRKAHTKHSEGKIWRGDYFVLRGKVFPGDVIYFS